MTILTIRAGKRYAVCQCVSVRGAGRASTRGLLIEVSQQGCRVSNLGAVSFEMGESVIVEVDAITLAGHIRWTGQGVLGIRFTDALFHQQLSELIARTRGTSDAVPRYGT
jgi:hypothetical protein